MFRDRDDARERQALLEVVGLLELWTANLEPGPTWQALTRTYTALTRHARARYGPEWDRVADGAQHLLSNDGRALCGGEAELPQSVFAPLCEDCFQYADLVDAFGTRGGDS
jgi:hypothetical protein